MDQHGWVLLAAVAVVLLVAGLALAHAVRRQQRQRDHIARVDPLTGLGNRLALTEHADRIFGRRARDNADAPALLLMDLDGFKDVNDTLGHAAGDLLLVQVAERLTIVGDGHGRFYRLGGDEFAVVVEDPGSLEDITMFGKQLLAGLGAGGFNASGVDLDIGASIGVAHGPMAGSTLPELLKCADVAMYAAKRTRAGVLLYTSDLDPNNRDSLGTLALLRGAMENGQLELHYQPVVGAADSRLLGFEALLRWQHPTRGLLLPPEFLPLAERTSLIRPLTRWVLITALRQAASWRAEGAELTIAVNISAAALEEGLLGILDEALALTRWPVERLILEVTESSLARDAHEAVTVVTRLRQRGVQVAIDDFGAGFTGLGQLRTLPVHQLKIDRQFVTGVAVDRADEAIVASIIALAHRLGLTVVAEGVETRDAARALSAMGCDELQGHLVGRPMCVRDATARVRESADGVTTVLPGPATTVSADPAA